MRSWARLNIPRRLPPLSSVADLVHWRDDRASRGIGEGRLGDLIVVLDIRQAGLCGRRGDLGLCHLHNGAQSEPVPLLGQLQGFLRRAHLFFGQLDLLRQCQCFEL